MQAPLIPESENLRLSALESLKLLDSEPEEYYDRITRLCQLAFDVPIALVSLVDADRQWFKSRQGLDATETSRAISFCGHAILQQDPFVIEDASEDARFADNPLVTGDLNLRFYAGCPLSVYGGQNIGTLCLIDDKPREFSEKDERLLRHIARLLEQHLINTRSAGIDDTTRFTDFEGLQNIYPSLRRRMESTETSLTLTCVVIEGMHQYAIEENPYIKNILMVELGIMLKANTSASTLISRTDDFTFIMLAQDTSVEEAEIAMQSLMKEYDETNSGSIFGMQLSLSAGASSLDSASFAPYIRDAMNKTTDRLAIG